VIKESAIMEEIHKIRERFYRETKGKKPEYVLQRIKEDSQKIIEDLNRISPDPRLMARGKYSIPQAKSMIEIQQIREGRERYKKK